ncbi:WD40 repeat-like protein [Suillus weaverae]|nr:WD40 repeat-like protein [Suillus weaverae]
MAEGAVIPSNTPIQTYEDHEESILSVAVFPDGRRMVTGSIDRTLRLWNLKNGVVLKKMEGHGNWVRSVAVTGDGQLITSGDDSGNLITWDGDTGESLSQAIQAHNKPIYSLDFSPDGAVLVTGSLDETMKLWRTEMRMQLQLERVIYCGDVVLCVRYSPSGEHLAIATKCDIQIWNPSSIQCIVTFEGHAQFRSTIILNYSLAWTPDGAVLLSGGNNYDPTIREWDTSTWRPVGGPWKGHTDRIGAIAVNSTGTLVASASIDRYVRLWRLSDQQTIAVFKHSSWVNCLAFSSDGKEIFSGGWDMKISKWAVPEDVLPHANTSAISTTAHNAALLNAQKAIDLNPSSFRGYQLEHEAFHSAQRYDKAMAAFEIMLSKLENAPNTHIRKLRRRYLSPSEAEIAIRTVIHAQLDNRPLRVLDTTTGLLCDREAQIRIFKMSTEYNELLLFKMKYSDLKMKHIEEVAAMYLSCAMLSHRWEGNEPLLHDIQDKAVYDLDALGGIMKLQSFCKVARRAGYRWAWSDTCCIDKTNNVELQESLNSMFVWYRHSALTIVYLSDVPPRSKAGALAKSAWNTRGWTIGEFLAPRVILFYQQDWTLYLNDRSSNHKESVGIMQELGDAVGVDPRAIVAFRPGTTGAREKLQWSSTRVTTLQEDIAYSLFGIFKVHLPVIYGEKKQNALGRLLQEIVARSGDISALDWIGTPSEFNSCLPADITSYNTSPPILSSMPEDEMEKSVSFLQKVVTVELASEFYALLVQLSAPRFANCRLLLPCITFPVTGMRWRRGQSRETSFTYEVKAEGLHDLLITTEDKPNHFLRAKLTRQTLLLVRPWTRSSLELSDFENDMQSETNLSEVGSSLYSMPPGSRSRALRLIPRIGQSFGSFLDSLRNFPGDKEAVNSESHLQALQLIVRLGQPFSALLLAQQPSGEYKRIASDRHIIAQVKDMASVRSMMDVRTLEIL